MRYPQIIILLLLSVSFTKAAEDRIVELETIGGWPRFTLESERIGIFQFRDADDDKGIEGLEIKYQNKERKINYVAKTNDLGEVSIPVIWLVQQYQVLENENGEIDKDSILPEELIGPTGKLFARVKRKWIKCKFPHEDSEGDSIVVEFIDWVVNDEDEQDASRNPDKPGS